MHLKNFIDNPTHTFNPFHVFAFMANSGLLNFLRDDLYLRLLFRAYMGEKLDLNNPQSFNAKLQWLKLNDHRLEYVSRVDKLRVRDFVKETIGEEYLVPLLGVWDRPEEIDEDSLPDQFVLKCNHNSKVGICICKDKANFDFNGARKELAKGLKSDFYLKGREWPYRAVPRKIIAEKYLEDSNGELNDYKFFCFDGYVDNVMIVTGRSSGNPKFYHFDRNWHICHFNRLCRTLPDDFTLPKPAAMDKMFELASVLSKGVPHVRIDLYEVDGQIYFGEYTLYNLSGFETGFDPKTDSYLGGLISLPKL